MEIYGIKNGGNVEDRTCVRAPWTVKFTNPYLLHMDISLSIFNFNVSFYVRYLKIWSYIYFWNINLRNRSCPKWHIWSEKIFGFDQKLVQSPRKYSMDIILIILCKNMVSIVEMVWVINDTKFQKIDMCASYVRTYVHTSWKMGSQISLPHIYSI